ncbi:MAG: MotA/TolQ/ExbB proton channel family protein [Prolixibacteraceae bacterium]|nr:MotA/TolQ/ExbB proton channel family protein [Prolixibacteraceae bacterium]
MFDFLRTGGILGMTLITIFALIVLILAVVVAYDVYAKKNYSGKGLAGILFFGSLAPLMGIIWQMLGMMQAFKAIQEAADISLGIVMGGLKVSMLAPLYGFFVLLFSALIWFVLRTIIKSKQS